jgi:hypothetical protein
MKSIGQISLGIVAAVSIALAIQSLAAQSQHSSHSGHDAHMAMSDAPSSPGQDAFGAIQEIVRLLESDPKTDWAKVSISALRNHLIDMHEVTLNAVAVEHALSNGIEILATGQGRTIGALQRMVPAHTEELAALGWSAKTERLENGVKLTVTSSHAGEVAKLKALGFMGLMVQGSHHQPHHLMIAKGRFHH